MSDKSESVTYVEVRGFGDLKKVFDARNWDFPYYYPLDLECTAIDLAKSMALPLDKIEGVFINGFASPLSEAMVQPGDRVGFIPIGVPGPYRVLLGFKKLPKEFFRKE